MSNTKKVNELNLISDIQDGDILVGERVNGTTVRIPYVAPTGISDGDKGDIVVTSSGTVWTIDTPPLVTVAPDDKVIIKDTSASDILKYVTAQSIADLASGGVVSVNGETGAVTLTTDDISDTAQSHKFVTSSDITKLSSLSGTNTGDQTSIVGITGTKSQFDTAVTDGNILYVGDITQYTDEMAQDATGAMVGTSIVYDDAAATLQRAALTGDVTASQDSNTTTVALPASATIAVDDKVYIFDTSASDAKKYVTTQSIRDLVPGSGTITSAQLATALTDETGSGAAVFAISPTLTTPVLGVATATSLSFGDEALANYDEGTYTPTFTFATAGDLSVVYNQQTGTYTRIGNLVMYRGVVGFTPTYTTASGDAQLGGLPFTTSAQGMAGVLQGMSANIIWPAGTSIPVPFFVASATYVKIREIKTTFDSVSGPTYFTTSQFLTGNLYTIAYNAYVYI
jgi:hypothetical protein